MPATREQPFQSLIRKRKPNENITPTNPIRQKLHNKHKPHYRISKRTFIQSLRNIKNPPTKRSRDPKPQTVLNLTRVNRVNRTKVPVRCSK